MNWLSAKLIGTVDYYYYRLHDPVQLSMSQRKGLKIPVGGLLSLSLEVIRPGNLKQGPISDKNRICSIANFHRRWKELSDNVRYLTFKWGFLNEPFPPVLSLLTRQANFAVVEKRKNFPELCLSTNITFISGRFQNNRILDFLKSLYSGDTTTTSKRKSLQRSNMF